jgi:hypothetical protein
VPCLAQFPDEFGLDYWPVCLEPVSSCDKKIRSRSCPEPGPQESAPLPHGQPRRAGVLFLLHQWRPCRPRECRKNTASWELRTPPESPMFLFDFAGHLDRTGNQAIGRNPSCIPIFQCRSADRTLKATDLSARGHVFGTLINRAALTGSVMRF